MKVYDWGFFFETGDKAVLTFPFGPDRPNNTIFDLTDPWIGRALLVYPNLVLEMAQMGLPFSFALVNPPRDASEAEEKYWKDKGYE